MENIQYSQNNQALSHNIPGQNTGNVMYHQSMPPQKGTTFMGNTMGDSINTLPTDKNKPSEVDKNITDTIFGENSTITDKLVKEGKDMFIFGLLFIIFSLPQLDDIIKKFIPLTEKSIYALIIIKAILLMVSFWLIKHFYLSRK
jgi:hypothetical protein